MGKEPTYIPDYREEGGIVEPIRVISQNRGGQEVADKAREAGIRGWITGRLFGGVSIDSYRLENRPPTTIFNATTTYGKTQNLYAFDPSGERAVATAPIIVEYINLRGQAKLYVHTFRRGETYITRSRRERNGTDPIDRDILLLIDSTNERYEWAIYDKSTNTFRSVTDFNAIIETSGFDQFIVATVHSTSKFDNALLQNSKK